MGIKKLYEIWCDGPECNDWQSFGRWRSAVEGLAKAAGWVKRKRKWLCPHCKNKSE